MPGLELLGADGVRVSQTGSALTRPGSWTSNGNVFAMAVDYSVEESHVPFAHVNTERP